MTPTKVLFFLHNHPSIRPGGSESYALELYESMRSSPDFDPTLVARLGPDVATDRKAHTDAPFSTVNSDPKQYFFFTEEAHFDFVFMTLREKARYTSHFANFLRAQNPDVVHFQHTYFYGIDFLTLTRSVLPDVPIVYTLHEFLPICNRDGQMLRTNGELCLEASPRRCNECFPDVPPQHFFLRERFAKAHLEKVDVFLAPSRFLMERYVDWGIPREKIRFEDYGRGPQPRLPGGDAPRPRNRLGYFGQANPFKGHQVLLRAMAMLRHERPDIHLWLNAANFSLQKPYWKEEFPQLLEAAGDSVTFAGAYDHASVPRRMAQVDWVIVPSLWWENSPLVIQEAFMHGRPVICSNIGGMAEKVTHGVNGLHFAVADPVSLAQVIRDAVDTPGLWDQLRAGMPDVYTMEQHMASLRQLYAELIGLRSPQAALAS